jgi:hypothetical protein
MFHSCDSLKKYRVLRKPEYLARNKRAVPLIPWRIEDYDRLVKIDPVHVKQLSQPTIPGLSLEFARIPQTTGIVANLTTQTSKTVRQSFPTPQIILSKNRRVCAAGGYATAYRFHHQIIPSRRFTSPTQPPAKHTTRRRKSHPSKSSAQIWIVFDAREIPNGESGFAKVVGCVQRAVMQPLVGSITK